jgi:multidrug efflux pump subunit AcrA (membrane-fusion protein)
MSSTEKHDLSQSAWQELERFVDQLHGLARAPVDASHFYRRLLEGCATTLAATGGAVWRRDPRGAWAVVHQINLALALERGDQQVEPTHASLLDRATKASGPMLYPPRSGTDDVIENPTDAMLLVGSVPRDDGEPMLVELFFPPGQSPTVQQGWRELLETVLQIAADYHVWDEYRLLRSEHEFHGQALALLRRVHGRTGLRRTAFEIANEGRRLVDADRLSVVVRRGRTWRLLAVSGVDRIEARADAAKSLEQLADWAARWGEPIEFSDRSQWDELPTELAELIGRHADQSQARRLVAVPLEFLHEADDDPAQRKLSAQPSAVLIAEQFQTEGAELCRQRVIELAHLCQPALGEAVRLDRFPLRSVLRWSDRWARLGWVKDLNRLTLAALAAAAVVAALAFVERDYEIEAPARLTPLVERDVFATANGAVAEIRVSHGDQVEVGDVLAVLDDPQLVLDQQRVRGEIDTTRKRREAIDVARTDRKFREQDEAESLSLSAEAQQLEQRLTSLRRQEEILAARREALTLRSPIAGTVLTLDVQHLLETRPVARGQVLFTVADTTAGWRLLADVPQDRIGQVVAAGQDAQEPLPVRFRLSGDLQHAYNGHVEAISETAVLNTDNLDGELPPIEVRVAIDDKDLAAARPGMNAQVRIDCGRRSLGYIWLHDAWESITSWLAF